MSDTTEQTQTVTDDAGIGRGWPANWGPGLALLLAAVALVTLAFHQTAWSIVSIWDRSQTYAHGFLIIPISLWLVWEKRAGLKHLTPRPTALPLVLFLPFGFAWLVGHLVDTAVVQQFAYVGLLVVTIWSALGHRVARFLAFPMLFLFLGVPMGEGLVNPMMNFTADFTVGMLKLTGIPVYREGTFFTIPSGQWSVVEACSGMRYLIASVTLGVLFAYLTYTKWWKRLLFVLFSIVVPVIANGFRAYMIVMIGHLSGMKLAAGVDHLIYGWVFFGIIVTIMFVVGSIWRDPPAPLPQPEPARPQPITGRGALRLLLVLAVCTLSWPAAAWALSHHGGTVTAVDVRAPRVSGWRLLSDADGWDWRPHVVGTDGSLYAFYAADGAPRGRPVGLYIGVYRTQRQGAELATYANVMVEEKHPVWSDLLVRPRRVTLKSGELALKQHLLSSRRGTRLLVWTWYLVGDRHTANPYLAKLLEAKSRLFGRRGEAALIAVATPYDDKPEAAAAVLKHFLDDMLPAIDAGVDRSLRSAP
ncbi:MAG: exosortase A [Thiohalocapsa sp.]|jgi:exosortase A|uniref:exosortase A n=1 Tax=Thiohalocapsa sp. TaxID=2497641 RepID=UPI0025EC7D20|nr:exosortase A [Thiohalocapsa sp.]MCG6940120.1 exosortase A [Thiohalocapsa sp.]